MEDRPVPPADPLIVAISSRALFDLEDSHVLFEREGLEAYAAFQRTHEDELLAPGIAFPLVRKLLALNTGTPDEAPRVEVILLSRNSSDTGLRIFNSIEHHGLGIRRAAFSNGAPPYPYIRPFGADLGNAIPGDDDDAPRQHLTGRTVEQASGTNRHRAGRWSALVHAAIGSDAWRRPRPTPGRRRRLHLRRRQGGAEDHDRGCERKHSCHR